MSDTLEIRAEFRRTGSKEITDSVPWSVDTWKEALEYAEGYAKESGALLVRIFLDEGM